MSQQTTPVLKDRTVDALSVGMEHEPVPAEQSVEGNPSTAAQELGEIFGVEFGLWEMSAGTMTDVEAEELFVVLSGSATVQIHAENGFAAAELHLVPGTVCHLSEGMHTSWTLHEPLRKMYLVAAE
ncbi:cupin [Arthrobacter sp. MYb227]|uniref:cupin domain-containing protein n=1 Tax=Arthrobacter sp. MYb227 TaxID=1848601 RepID=UPI000CFCDDCD|nr:cupin domain-containing protein [Arthrobacter sp. MYb227]PQZ94833.1 cupin [Arthrobacter sp. MYb227]